MTQSQEQLDEEDKGNAVLEALARMEKKLDKLDCIEKDIKSINDRLGKFNERVKALEGQMDGQNTRIQLAEDAIKNQGSRLIEFEGRIMNLERTSELMEKKQLEYSVVLSGLDFFQPTIKEIIRPKDPNGRLSLVEKIAIYLEAKEIDVQYCEIKDAQQINDTKHMYLVTLTSKAAKIALLVGNKILRQQNPPIYANEQLTKKTANIFKEARRLRRENLLDSTWTRNGELFIRYTLLDREHVEKIISIEHLHNVLRIQTRKRNGEPTNMAMP